MDNSTSNGVRVKELFISLTLWPEYIFIKGTFYFYKFCLKIVRELSEAAFSLEICQLRDFK